MTAITRPIAEFVRGCGQDSAPKDVLDRARLIVLDHVGIALRARYAAELSPVLESALQTLGQVGNCTVIGDGRSYSPTAAAMFNGNLGHALDFDDTHTPGSLHSGAPIIPAALAAAELTGADGKAVLAGIVAGFEVQIRLSLALDPSAHYNQGFHPTATCGVFGAAAAASVVMALDTDQIESALGLCGSQAAGSMKFLVDGSWNKPYHVGFAAANGLSAAIMARAGFRGAKEIFEDRFGFFTAYAPAPNPERAIEALGSRYEQLDIAVKPYPSCRYSHAAMDALMALRGEHQIDEGEIESVEIGMNDNGMTIIGVPLEAKHNPGNYVEGQFSMPFCAAVVLRDGTMNWDSYAKHLSDPKTLALCKKITPVLDAAVQAEFPANMSGAARVKTARGTFEKLVVVPKGEPTNFVTDEELRAKFDGLVEPYLDASTRDQLAERLLRLEQESDISNLLDLTLQAGVEPLKLAGSGDD